MTEAEKWIRQGNVKLQSSDREVGVRNGEVHGSSYRWPLKDDFEDLAPLRHMIEDLSSENDLSQPMVHGAVWLLPLSESMLARRL